MYKPGHAEHPRFLDIILESRQATPTYSKQWHYLKQEDTVLVNGAQGPLVFMSIYPEEVPLKFGLQGSSKVLLLSILCSPQPK